MNDHRFAHQISRFLKEMQAVGRQETTLRTYRRTLHYFADYAAERRCENDVRAVGSELLKEYRLHVQHKKDISTDTRIRLLLCLKTFYAWLAEQGLVLIDLSAAIRLPKMSGKKLPPYLTQDEVKRFIESPDLQTPRGLRDRAILEALYSTGMRVAECCRLQIADINFADGVVRIISGKGKKDRMVPIGSLALHYIDRYFKEVRGPGAGGPLFRRMGTADPVNTGQLYRYMQEYRKKAAITKRMYPHLLRHSFGVHLLENGADIRYIQAMMGHEHLSTTQIYTQVVPFQLKKAHAAAHPAERRRKELPADLAPEKRFRPGWMK